MACSRAMLRRRRSCAKRSCASSSVTTRASSTVGSSRAFSSSKRRAVVFRPNGMKRMITIAVALLLLTGLSPSDTKLTERQRAMHALNRLAFGARPGDVDRVMQIGVDNWIDQQLHPESIADRNMETRLDQYATLKMSDAQIITKYYVPIIKARKAKKENATPEEIQ